MLDFFKGKNIFITGHTGFKGSWLCAILVKAGANVTGYALNPTTNPSLFKLADIEKDIQSVSGDIRNFGKLRQVFDDSKPDIVIHLAAQPIVREGYKNPKDTYETNVMGTVNILECIRQNQCVKSILNVTTDKVYENKEWMWGYREDDILDGYDPYSNSKSCSEVVTHCYWKSFFKEAGIPISTARAGNVIGGGDFAPDRIVPDCVRAVIENKDIVVRNPYSTRPYQHVLDPLYAYLMIVQAQYINHEKEGWYNVGPDESSNCQTGVLADQFVKYWGNNLKWVSQYDGGPHEANFLKLDCSKIKTVIGWKPRWDIETAIRKSVEWYRCWYEQGDVRQCMDNQITSFLMGE